MAIVDERGRLFGRWNLLDVALAILILGLIPLGYASWVLFRDQPPRLVSVSPNRMEPAPEFRVTIKGENLRPYMRLSIGLQQGRDFIFKSTQEAEVPFVGIPPGQYDVVLYDQAQERFRLPNAVTISSSSLPSTELVIVGAFGNLDAASAAKLTAGMQLPGVGEIISAGKAVPDVTQVFSGSKLIAVPIPNALRLPAVVRFHCYVRTQAGNPFCTSDDVTMAPNVLVMVSTPIGKIPFQVQRVRSAQPIVSVPFAMRLQASPSVIEKIKAGDRDLGGVANEFAELSRIESVGPIRSLGAGLSEVDVKLIGQLQHGDAGWLYDSTPIRIGSTITLHTTIADVTGIVTDISAAHP